MAARHNQFDVVGRTSTAKAIRRFRGALRAGDCKIASVMLDQIETGLARRSTVHQLTDQFYAKGCARPWEKKR